MQTVPARSEIDIEFRRYEALLSMADSIARQRSVQSVCREVTTRLRQVLSLEFIVFNLHDIATNQMCVYYSEGLSLASESTNIDVDRSPSGWVWQQQKPLAISHVATEMRFRDVLQVLVDASIQSYCCVPLTSPRRRLGALGVGSSRANRFDAGDVAFLEKVGGMVALAMETALTYNSLEEEKDRLLALVEVNSTLVSNFDLQDSFPVISGYIRKVVAQDLASISVYDEANQSMRKYVVDCPSSPEIFQAIDSYPLRGSPSGTAFLERQTIITDIQGATTDSSPILQKLASHELQKICCIPLVARNGPLGTLNLASKDDSAFSPRDVALLKQIAAQIATALDNSRAYQEIAKLKDKLAHEKVYLEGEIHSVLNFDEIVGESEALRRVLDQAKTVAPSDATVLIQGETGTGKELIARAVHRMSARRDGSFIKLNCAAIPTGLLESELFGHEKGAFTGAISQKIGRLELADKGTLFLDEVGDIPMELQPKLLRVLQDQEFERLGSNRTLRVNVRLVAATNRDLATDKAYCPGETFCSAFARLFSQLFAEWGLILLDASDLELSAIAAPIYAEAIERSEELEECLLARGKELEAAGYHQQVKVIPSSTLIFSLKNGVRTPVHRRSADVFRMGDEPIEKQKLLGKISARPQDFSPNVLLRPVVQDYLLPTLTYTGGISETAYFAQASAIFQAIAERVTPVVPQFSATVLESKSQALLRKYGIQLTDVIRGPEAVRECLAAQRIPHAYNLPSTKRTAISPNRWRT